MKIITPLIKQYNEIKKKFTNTIILFRVGDFYEMFGTDAIKCSKVLNIVLTKRKNKGNTNSHVELAGFPHHSINNYLPKLVKAGFKIAICEELEKKNTKERGLLKRGVTEIITPGVVTNSDVLDAKKNNFLCAIFYKNYKTQLGISFLDISTGEFLVGEGNQNYINIILNKFLPKEIICPQKKEKDIKSILNNNILSKNIHLQGLEDFVFDFDSSYKYLIQHFKTNSLKGFNIQKLGLGISSAGAICSYVCNICNYKISHINCIKKISLENSLNIDNFSLENLEIISSKNEDALTLLKVLDFTKSPMGGRLLKKWLIFPLKDINKIHYRQNILYEFLNQKQIIKSIRNKLKKISDLERLSAKIVNLRANPYDLLLLKKSIKNIIEIKKILSRSSSNILKNLAKEIINCNKLYNTIEKVLYEEAPKKINVIKPGISKELDKLRTLVIEREQTILKICERERKQTGIKNIKINSNHIFGYYIEIKKPTKKIKVPKHWKIQQTLAKVERYISEELKNHEIKIKLAQESILKIESKILEDLTCLLLENVKYNQRNAKVIAKIDVMISLAICAKQNNYICPKVNNSFNLYIKDGRHPVIEAQIHSQGAKAITYIANDILFKKNEQQIFIITGPNMAGKSAILRKIAIIIIMAQVGSYIPASYAEIGIIEKIFIRVGASDNISIGESTFMNEMNETASILNNISERSLILLDEIGRGTSTYDGISIAWAIIEFLHNHPNQPFVLFSTHYHELNNMKNYYIRIRNRSISVKKINKQIIYTRKLLPFGCKNSYGINVAKIAGIPKTIIERSKKIMTCLKQMKKINSHIKYKIIKKNIENLNINTLTLASAQSFLKHIKFILKKQENK
ncbi:DNA mismatch repair protein MutS [Candidatus Karelsulcia muelleri]|uniref:DNA mismatch repair protein MutS n=1 Tax=Candidatus Karelsulcia muelleri TaxID=336810 RepID=UPI002364A5B6|nr:DNA mismatch repair protein MutS [Candidatus Karelsulcia muelleri]WDE42193.1 DNA mismatch repair protein MutS [Candidatus Karelsulcia muelleri]